MNVVKTSTKAPPATERHLGHQLRRIRDLLGVPQHELADRLRIGQAALSRLERRRDILVSNLVHYLEALGVGVRIDANLAPDAEKIHRGLKSRHISLPIIGGPPEAARRDLVLSIKPEYSTEIVSGRKTVELRRRFSPNIEPGTIALIYESSPTRALTGVASIAEVLHGPTNTIWKRFGDQACIRRSDFDSYFAGAKTGFAIKLRGARPLKRALELQELRDRFRFEPPQSFLYAPPELRKALLHECSELLN
ncbi:MAG TPA: helix-turn-helix domain-containing protein [Rhizomicrobium sp.]|nr:helix-turn-helix domain-containing protein [Rhizomicrobium sp.]